LIVRPLTRKICIAVPLTWFFITLASSFSQAWFDDTHLAIAQAAGYKKWYLAVGADMAKLKAGAKEGHNHFVNNPRGRVVTPEMVLAQAEKYNRTDPDGHLYGAIITSVRQYVEVKRQGRYADYHLGFAAHYVGDLSMPLHNTVYDEFNRRHHMSMDGIIDEEVMDNLNKIEIYSIPIRSERDLAKEIARIANLSMELGYRLQDGRRIISREEAYTQISHSASLLKAILEYVWAQEIN